MWWRIRTGSGSWLVSFVTDPTSSFSAFHIHNMGTYSQLILDRNIIHILVSHRNHVCIRFNCQEMAVCGAYLVWQLVCGHVAIMTMWHTYMTIMTSWHTYMTLWQQAPGQWSYLHMTGRSIWSHQIWKRRPTLFQSVLKYFWKSLKVSLKGGQYWWLSFGLTLFWWIQVVPRIVSNQ